MSDLRVFAKAKILFSHDMVQFIFTSFFCCYFSPIYMSPSLDCLFNMNEILQLVTAQLICTFVLAYNAKIQFSHDMSHIIIYNLTFLIYIDSVPCLHCCFYMNEI